MRYVVTGRVHPERADISFNRIEWQLPSGGVAVASCESSQITIVLNDPSTDGWITAFVQSEQLASIVVSALGFSLGSGYSLELIQVTEEDGTPHVFGVRPTGETPSDTLGFQHHIPIFGRVLSLANRDIFFRLALFDFVRAITEVVDCSSYCYRSIESIKSSFILKTGKDRWDDMHAALGTDKQSIKTIVKNYADPVRHGNWTNTKATTSADRWKMLHFTQSILIKYLDLEEPIT